MNKKIGVVTVTFNSAKVIKPFMQSALAQKHQDFILYVIDNASRDESIALVGQFNDPRVVVIANADNVGIAEGNNQGIRLALTAGCQFVLLINNDTEFGPDLFESLLSSLADSRLGIVVPKMMFYEPPDRIWCAGGDFNRWRAYAVRHFGEGELDRGQFDKARKIEYAPTCCMLIRDEVFKRIGLMDARYFVYADDADFCLRAGKFGIQIDYDPQAVLFHKVGSLTGGSQSDFVIHYGTRNRVYFILKHLNRVVAVYWLLMYQLLFLARLVTRRDSIAVYRKKRRAFSDGCTLYRVSVASD